MHTDHQFIPRIGEEVSDLWVYILGEREGRDLKIGKTASTTLKPRIKDINQEQTTNESYVLLCAVRASTKDEKALHAHFDFCRRGDKGTKLEYFLPDERLLEYVHWLRAQWWAVIDEELAAPDAPSVEPDLWLPGPYGRGLSIPERDPEMLIQPWQILEGTLAGTAWDWMPDPRPSIQDFYTPPEIVQAAREAMGDVDLDAASHWLANRTHRIADYFTIGRSAFEHDWHGRVWLNPPYGNNAPWFDRIIQFVDSGMVEQICILSPVWVFNTVIAMPIMDRVSGMILLSPTPKFWGHRDGRTGKNHPHAIVYIGERTAEFFEAFRPFGIPMRLVPAELEATAA